MTEKTKKNDQVRSPIITVMGHVDHGKSSLLDYIRRTNVVAGEAGGITQCLSAYEVKHQTEAGEEKAITFVDTPGHQAFSAMRNRSALIADIAILIISAEDSIKPQTKEALEIIQENKIPYVVAINKIDRPRAVPDKVKQDLAELGVMVESYGGQIPDVNISAITGEGIDSLLDILLLVAEMEELKTDSEKLATGQVLESCLDPQAGTLTTIVIKSGHLKTGQFIGVSGEIAKIKKMEDFLGQVITKARASAPVLIIGFNQPPAAGDNFIALAGKKEAEKYAREYQENQEPPSNSNEYQINDQDLMLIPIILKADTVGALEAAEQEIAKLEIEKVQIKIIQTGVGAISDSDLKTAATSAETIILGFNTKIDKTAKEAAERGEVPIITGQVIYEIIDKLTELMEKRRPKITENIVSGKVKVLKVFSQAKDKQVIGGEVKEGKIIKNQAVKINRRDAEIGEGLVVELQTQKIAATEIKAGEQFGAMIKAKTTITPGDELIIFTETER